VGPRRTDLSYPVSIRYKILNQMFFFFKILIRFRNLWALEGFFETEMNKLDPESVSPCQVITVPFLGSVVLRFLILGRRTAAFNPTT